MENEGWMPHILRMFFTAAGVMPISFAITLSKKPICLALRSVSLSHTPLRSFFSISVMDWIL